MANKIRVDSLSFFLASFGFFLFLRQRYVFSGFFLVAAAENHPYAVIFFLYCLAYLISIFPQIKKEPKAYLLKALIFILGCLLGAGYYFLLHWKWLGDMGDVANRLSGNAFVEYFWKAKYAVRHLPELIVFLTALVIVFVKKIYRKDRFILPFLFLMILGSIVLMRENYHYIVYLYPPVILVILLAFEKIHLRNLLLVGLLVFQLPVYGYLFWTQRKFSHKEYLSKVLTHVPEDNEIFIYGNAGAWFALKERNFHAYGYFARSDREEEDMPDEFLTLENADFRDQGYDSDLLERTGNEYRIEDVDQFRMYDGTDVFIRHFQKK